MTYRDANPPEAGPFDAYLDEDETVHVETSARRGLILTAADAPITLFALAWTGFVLFWILMASQAPFPFALFGLPFLAVGLFVLFGRHLLDGWRRGDTQYAVTDSRVLIKTRGTLESLPLRNLEHITLTERADGKGTVTLGKTQPFARFGRQGLDKSTRLELEDAAAFYRGLMAAKRRADGVKVRVASAEGDEDVVEAVATPSAARKARRSVARLAMVGGDE